MQVQAALDAGFNVPKTLFAATLSDILSTRESFLLILKPAKSVSPLQDRLYKRHDWICGSRGELESAVVEWANRVPLLALPCLIATLNPCLGNV